ncbi:cytochrome b/b6 domain-containing protein [Sedimentitalea arenosa]|uniref:Cytochrome b/b6 domain-containing protein n=1 Tax=Sedimentitalea arenosa TaxID=2798803 RepID=A0A8J7IMM6_9RHOB|nr:cytochrome b/b6 domain-containing protein [Arenibacterium arenosum]MBJ6373593.1 cytochrome b/b6 domain-containing protein [Arenibacterium arenosum]
MRLANTAAGYGVITKSFHWLTALLILTVIPLGIIAKDMAEALILPEGGADPDTIARAALLFSLHKTVGVAIFCTALARIAWALSQPKPGPVSAEQRVQVFLARTVHWLLYGSLLLVPLTGWAAHSAAPGFAPILWPFGQALPFIPASPRLADLFSGLHVTFERVLVISILLHVAGALKHHLIDRDTTLQRMWFGRHNGTQVTPAPKAIAPILAALAVWSVALGIGFATGLYDDQRGGSLTDSPRATSGSDWQVTDGTLGLTITQLGSTVTGSFSTWSADITFDETVESGRAGIVSVTIAVDSLTLGLVTEQAMGPEYLDTERHPTARFEGDILVTETGLIAEGPLTLKGASVPVRLPFTLDLANGRADISGTTQLNRLDYDIGSTVTDEGMLGFDVEVSVTLTATRATPEQ